jgi:hypothetical protein
MTSCLGSYHIALQHFYRRIATQHHCRGIAKGIVFEFREPKRAQKWHRCGKPDTIPVFF